MTHKKFSRFLRFLRQELAISKVELRLALRHPDTLSMILWQYGLVTLSQLNQIFDWLERLDRNGRSWVAISGDSRTRTNPIGINCPCAKL